MKRFNTTPTASLILFLMLILNNNIFSQDVKVKDLKSNSPGILNSQSPSGGGEAVILLGDDLNVSVGTLPAGDNIIITYSVVVDSPLTAGVTEVTNQGTVTSGNSSDVLTDDPDVGGAADPTITLVQNNDVGVIAINSPVGGGALTNAESVTLTIMNFTADDQTGFDVTYEVTGPVNSGLVTENIGALVVTGNSTEMYTFTTTADFSQPGSYLITAWTSLTDDINTTNDTLSSEISTALAVPVLDSPANNAVNVSVPAILKWFPVSSATSYLLQVSKLNNFSTFVFNSEVTDTTESIAGLEALTKYYWRVMAKNSQSESAWSTVWNFTTALLPPALVYPEDGTAGLPLSFELVWAREPQAATYHVQVSKNIDFTGQLVANKTGLKNTTYKLKGKDLSSGTTYYWRVRSFKSGVFSDFSPVWSFTTVPPNTNAAIILVGAGTGMLSKDTRLAKMGSANKILYFEGTESKVSYEINIPETGTWYAWARMFYESAGGKNSFFISANNQKHILGDDDEMYDQWHWDGYQSQGVNLGNLQAGKNKITVSGREPGQSLYIDQIIFTDDPNFYPTDENIASNEYKIITAQNSIPTDFELPQNYPNPFNPYTQIRFSLPVSGNVTLQVYNSSGQLVKTIQDGMMSEGNYEYQWDATNENGFRVSSGIYFYRINVTGSSSNFTKVNKMILLK